jgi:four helix bundle protein
MEYKRAVAVRVRDLEVYKLAFETAMSIFEITKQFPAEEKYSLTDQIRRSSRSICANLSEGWRKRKYRAAFINKLTECQQEAAETQTWLEFAQRCGYISTKIFNDLYEKYEHIFAMLITMERKTEMFCVSVRPTSERQSAVNVRRPTSNIQRNI